MIRRSTWPYGWVGRHSCVVDRIDIGSLGYLAVPPEHQAGGLGNQLLVEADGDLLHLYFWQYATDADPTGEWPEGQAGVVVGHVYVPWETFETLPARLTDMIDHFRDKRTKRDQSP